jgi:hypothetical protein
MHDKVERMPIYRKAEEIEKLVRHLMEVVPDDNTMLKHQKEFMLADALTIPAKIAGAEGGDLYDIRMENAALIRKAARDLVTGLRALEMFGCDEPQYFDLLRKEVEEFRLLFMDWVAAFDKRNYIPDSWGLFNPPGVGPDDEMPGHL